jgi:hypothetical protein
MSDESNIRLARVSSIVRNLKPSTEEDMLRAIRPILYATDLMDFGTPGALEERKQARRLRLYRHAFWAGIIAAALIGVFLLGYNMRVHKVVAVPGKKLSVVSEVCTPMKLVRLANNRDVVYTDCRRVFSDRSWYHREGM